MAPIGLVPEPCEPVGSAASRGKAGSGPSTEPVGETTVPAPTAKPGPTMYATAQITALGRYASWASSSSPAPTRPGPSRPYTALNWRSWLASAAAAVRRPAALSTASDPADPARIDRDRPDIRLPSVRQDATPRAAPNHAATKATANPARTAC